MSLDVPEFGHSLYFPNSKASCLPVQRYLLNFGVVLSLSVLVLVGTLSVDTLYMKLGF